MKILALIAVLLLSSCTFFEPIKQIVRDYEKRAATSVVDSSSHLLCNSPLTTIMNRFESEQFVAWITMCDHQIPGYKLVPIDEIP